MEWDLAKSSNYTWSSSSHLKFRDSCFSKGGLSVIVFDAKLDHSICLGKEIDFSFFLQIFCWCISCIEWSILFRLWNSCWTKNAVLISAEIQFVTLNAIPDCSLRTGLLKIVPLLHWSHQDRWLFCVLAVLCISMLPICLFDWQE